MKKYIYQLSYSWNKEVIISNKSLNLNKLLKQYQYWYNNIYNSEKPASYCGFTNWLIVNFNVKRMSYTKVFDARLFLDFDGKLERY